MKKKIVLGLISCLCTTQIFAADITDYMNQGLQALGITSGGDLISGNIPQCYTVDFNQNIPDICKMLDFKASFSTNICSGLPDILGLTKHSSNNQIGGSTNALEEYCKPYIEDAKYEAKRYLDTQKERFEQVVSAANLWATQYASSSDGKLPSGETIQDFYTDISKDLENTNLQDSASTSLFMAYALSNGKYDQATAKFMLDMGMNMDNPNDLIDYKFTAPMVAANMNDYNSQKVALIKEINMDLPYSSPNTISTDLANTLDNYTDQAGQFTVNQNAQTKADMTKKFIADNASRKKGILKNLLSSDDDFAIPTQESLKNYKDSVRPKYAMLIKKQQMREAYIEALVDTETKLKQDIVDLTTKKAVIMKSQFDEEAAGREIDALIGEGDSLVDAAKKATGL